MLARSANYAFLVWVSGLPISPVEQGHYVIEARLRAKGYDSPTIRQAVELDRRIVNVYRTNTGWEEVTEALRQVSSEDWFKDAGLGLESRDSRNWQWYRRFMDYDPMPVLKNLSDALVCRLWRGGSTCARSAVSADSRRVENEG